MFRTAILAAFISVCSVWAFCSASPAFADSSCDGYDTVTNDYVYGDCQDGTFSGYNKQGREFVDGTCTDGGDMQGTGELSDDPVSGSCTP